MLKDLALSNPPEKRLTESMLLCKKQVQVRDKASHHCCTERYSRQLCEIRPVMPAWVQFSILPFLVFPVDASLSEAGPKTAYVLGGRNQSNLLLYVTTKHVFENFRGAIAHFPPLWLRAWSEAIQETIWVKCCLLKNKQQFYWYFLSVSF